MSDNNFNYSDIKYSNAKEKLKLSQYGFDILQIETTAACNMACSFAHILLKMIKFLNLI